MNGGILLINSNTVSIFETADYSAETLRAAVEKHFSALGLEDLIKPETKVMIKPNLLMKASPEASITTHPELVAALINKLQSMGVQNIVIAESPGGTYSKPLLSMIYGSCGYKRFENLPGVTLNYDFSSKKTTFPEGKTVREFELISPVFEADFIISVAKLKTHAHTGLSGAVKNLFGTVPGLMKPEFHFRFQEKEPFCDMLVDLCECVKPSLAIVDAVWSMEGDGPSGGTKKYTGLTVASQNPYFCDLALCGVMGFDPSEAGTVTASIQRGLCPDSLSELTLVGDTGFIGKYSFIRPKSVKPNFVDKLPHFLNKPVEFIEKKFLSPRPKLQRKLCVGCGRCAESCPAKAIDIVDRKAVIHDSECIRCFCCQEMCPVKAIVIKRFSILKL